MKKALALALIAAAAASVGCASSKEKRAAREANPAPCPNIIVLTDADRLVEFDGDAALENVTYSAEIVNVALNCRYYADKPIDASVDIDFAFGKGPKGEAGSREFKYFVAVTRTNLEVIEKSVFSVPVKFDSDKSVRLANEKIKEIIIPRASESTSGTNFEVVVGLVLTPQQAIYNRSGKSLKFPEL